MAGKVTYEHDAAVVLDGRDWGRPVGSGWWFLCSLLVLAMAGLQKRRVGCVARKSESFLALGVSVAGLRRGSR